MAILVAHPDTQHSVHAARGLRRAGLLECLYTSFSLRRPRWLGPIIERCAPSAYARLAQHRGHADFATEELRVYPLHLVASRFGREWSRGTRRSFGRAAARLAAKRGAGVMAFDSNALETFRCLEGRGLPRILDQSIAHRRWRERVCAEERASFPDWEQAWDSSESPAHVIEEEDEEIARADLILCGSEFCASTMRAEGVAADKLAVAEYGADTVKFAPGEPQRTASVRLLFVGALQLRKGVPYLLEAVQRLEGLGVKLTLAGLVRIRQERLLPYSDFAQVLGSRLHAEMPGLYRSHDIYVFPSLVEGSSLSIYEALASGLPVITTPNSGSIVRDGVEGLLVPPRDVEALAHAIERLAREPELRLEMGRAARRRAVQFGTWESYGARLAGRVLARFPEVARS